MIRGNEFLSQFIEMRKGIAATNPSAAAAVAAAAPASKKAKKTSKKQVFTDCGVENIIEHRPGRKEVEEYFQKRCDDLTTEVMSK
jgi:membrane protease subunit (stomatin/prohibitin family)